MLTALTLTSTWRLNLYLKSDRVRKYSPASLSAIGQDCATRSRLMVSTIKPLGRTKMALSATSMISASIHPITQRIEDVKKRKSVRSTIPLLVCQLRLSLTTSAYDMDMPGYRCSGSWAWTKVFPWLLFMRSDIPKASTNGKKKASEQPTTLYLRNRSFNKGIRDPSATSVRFTDMAAK